jgi:hypothetical protein
MPGFCSCVKLSADGALLCIWNNRPCGFYKIVSEKEPEFCGGYEVKPKIVPAMTASKSDYRAMLEPLFRPCLQSADPLLDMFKRAIEKDISPVDALFYWIDHGCKNSRWFTIGIRQQKQLLVLITSQKDYATKYAVEFLNYLARISSKW